ncbi:MAG: Pony 38 [Bacillales bacterium]|nr:Pony 38 [Bacillales bacterium]
MLSDCDFLVLDDLGAETGAIDTGKAATDFVQRVFYAIMNARQGKVTIITTNLSSEKLFSIYDKKLVSRLLRNPQFIIFKETLDKRISILPF